MNPDTPLADLIEISRFAGVHPHWVQGGGGNCSVKDGGKMWVKASGCFLEEVSEEKGYAVVDSATGKPLDEARGKASMETPLHTLLGAFVIHTHPTVVTAWVASVEGKAQFKSVFPEAQFIWIDYATPGSGLYEKVKSTVSLGSASADLVLFLENHGLFVSSASKQKAIELHKAVIQRLENFFGSTEKAPAISKERCLTPDHAIYGFQSHSSLSGKRKVAADETLLTVRQALGLMAEKGWSPRWISQPEVAVLLNMEEEKYRQERL